MALPNLNRPSAVLGKNSTQAITTNAMAIVSNPAASGKSIRVVSLYVANVDGTDAASVTVSVFDGTTSRHIANTVAVPADSTISVITREDFVYLNEGDSVRLTASADGDLEAICSYEEIS
jgi:hypothetical protein